MLPENLFIVVLLAKLMKQASQPSFWKVRGYTNHGDAFKEERYS